MRCVYAHPPRSSTQVVVCFRMRCWVHTHAGLPLHRRTICFFCCHFFFSFRFCLLLLLLTFALLSYHPLLNLSRFVRQDAFLPSFPVYPRNRYSNVGFTMFAVRVSRWTRATSKSMYTFVESIANNRPCEQCYFIFGGGSVDMCELRLSKPAVL